jgi:hypothetical protein
VRLKATKMKLWMLEMTKLKICNNHMAKACRITQVTSIFHQQVASIVELHSLKQ